jgi:hypothetical protein
MVAIGLALLGGIIARLTVSEVRIDRNVFNAIEVGMTEGEVVHLIGGVPGRYACPNVRPVPHKGTMAMLMTGEILQWTGTLGNITVLTSKGRVMWKQFRDVE